MALKTNPNLKKLHRVENKDVGRLGCLRLDKSENVVLFDKKTVNEIKASITPELISSYPETWSLYQKMSKWLKRSTDNIYISMGSDGAIKATFEVFVGKGDEVVVLHPTYAMYYVYAEMFGAKVKKVTFTKELDLDPEKIRKAITKKTQLVCIANPNSPTGTLIEKSQLRKIIAHAKKMNAVVLVDEAYFGYCTETFINETKRFSNLIVTRSFTKAYGLGSARLGYAVAHKNIVADLKKVRPIYEVNSFAVLLGEYIIDHPQIFRKTMKLVKEGKKHLEQGLTKMGLDFFSSHGNFVNIKSPSPKHAAYVQDALQKRKILIKSRFGKDTPLANCFRVSLSQKSDMALFLKNLKSVIGSVGYKKIR
ncbi:MAG: histidinol-phosphate aminotransferase family protein [Candidatus Lindowbacteria bacterium]|nr:histidinol-phosphate aminotransferase family protein [Candidatus Lindowbacteria bacterium]